MFGFFCWFLLCGFVVGWVWVFSFVVDWYVLDVLFFLFFLTPFLQSRNGSWDFDFIIIVNIIIIIIIVVVIIIIFDIMVIIIIIAIIIIVVVINYSSSSSSSSTTTTYYRWRIDTLLLLLCAR